MPRAKKVAAAQETPASELSPPTTPEASPASEPQDSEPKGQWVSKLPEPHGRHGIDLGDGRRLVLSLSRRWNQNMIQFVATSEDVDPKPSKEDTEFLKANGWRWRSEEQGWTRQLDKNTDENRFGRAKSDREAEDQFVTLAHAIRSRNGLEPTSYSFGQEISR